MIYSLRWRHNELDGVSDHQPHDCLFNRLFGRRSKKTSKPRVNGLCVGNSPGTGEFPAQMASNAENASIWWRHHVVGIFTDCILSCTEHHYRSFLTPLSAAYTRQWTGSTLVQVMASRLFGAKPLPEPMVAFCQLDPWEQISVKFESEFYHCHPRKCLLSEWRPFCPGGDESSARLLIWAINNIPCNHGKIASKVMCHRIWMAHVPDKLLPPDISTHCTSLAIGEKWPVSWMYFYLRFFQRLVHMITSSNGNIFRVTGHMCGQFTGRRWILRTKASDAELWCFLWIASE